MTFLARHSIQTTLRQPNVVRVGHVLHREINVNSAAEAKGRSNTAVIPPYSYFVLNALGYVNCRHRPRLFPLVFDIIARPPREFRCSRGHIAVIAIEGERSQLLA